MGEEQECFWGKEEEMNFWRKRKKTFVVHNPQNYYILFCSLVLKYQKINFARAYLLLKSRTQTQDLVSEYNLITCMQIKTKRYDLAEKCSLGLSTGRTPTTTASGLATGEEFYFST